VREKKLEKKKGGSEGRKEGVTTQWTTFVKY